MGVVDEPHETMIKSYAGMEKVANGALLMLREKTIDRIWDWEVVPEESLTHRGKGNLFRVDGRYKLKISHELMEQVEADDRTSKDQALDLVLWSKALASCDYLLGKAEMNHSRMPPDGMKLPPDSSDVDVVFLTIAEMVVASRKP